MAQILHLENTIHLFSGIVLSIFAPRKASYLLSSLPHQAAALIIPPLVVVPNNFKKGVFTISFLVKDELIERSRPGARYNNEAVSI